VVLEDGYQTAPAQVRPESLSGKGAWLRVIMREGRKRQIREIGSRLSLPVVKIIRVRIGTLHLGNLKPREWRHLTPEEVAMLKRLTVSKGRPGKARPQRGKVGSKPKKRGVSSHPRRMQEKSKHT
jgi:23S rRNA pseudouridine2605 synthase